MSETERSSTAASPRLDRREFIAGAGAVAAVAALPLADWTIDDMWGVYPRYAEPIGYGRAHVVRELHAQADPADLPFLA